MKLKVICPKHGAQMVSHIAPIGPSMTRPALPVLDRLPDDGELYGADPGCSHYITYRGWEGIMCVRCPGWFCH